MSATARFTQTAASGHVQTSAYRYNVKRNGVVHCRSNDFKLLCADCQRTAKACDCDTCKAERGHAPSKAAPMAPPAATAPAAAPRAAAKQSVPPAPSTTAAILARRGITPTTTTQLANNPKNGIPPAPSLREAILRRRGAK